MYPADRDQSQQPWMPDDKVESRRGLGSVKSGPKLGKTLELWAKTKNCKMGVAPGCKQVPFCRKRLAPSRQRPMSSASPSSIRTIRASPCLETAPEPSQLPALQFALRDPRTNIRRTQQVAAGQGIGEPGSCALRALWSTDCISFVSLGRIAAVSRSRSALHLHRPGLRGGPEQSLKARLHSCFAVGLCFGDGARTGQSLEVR